jgi:Rrf2 family transcriptional regulator, nitric oxide-sensitive transcriptional repressor
MQLTLYSDYAFRTLIFLAKAPNTQVTITEISNFYNISRNHLVKVVHQLSKSGFIKTFRGKHGGIKLARPACDINLGDVFRKFEKKFDPAVCLNKAKNQCAIQDHCNVKTILHKAEEAYLAVLCQYSVADAYHESITITSSSVTCVKSSYQDPTA